MDRDINLIVGYDKSGTAWFLHLTRDGRWEWSQDPDLAMRFLGDQGRGIARRLFNEESARWDDIYQESFDRRGSSEWSVRFS